MRSEKITGQRAYGHDAGFWPIHKAGENKPNAGDKVYQRAKQVFKGVHLVDVVQTDERQRGEHEDTDARAEVAAIKCDGELKQNCAENRMRMTGLCLQVRKAS